MRRRDAFWSVVYRTPSRAAILKYSFRVRTARGTYWYGDDNSGADTQKGGAGTTTRLRGDGFQLTVYAPAFTTPSWLQGAVVYESQEIPGLVVAVDRAPGKKCERCWTWSERVGENAEHPALCERCVPVIAGA